MKKLLLILMAIAGLCSCKRQSLIDKNIAEYMKKNGHNPESYEAISTICTDTIIESKRLASSIELIIDKIKSDSSSIAFWKPRINSDSSSPENIEFNIYDKDYKLHKQELAALQLKSDSLRKSTNINPISGYHFIHQCRARIPLGGMMLKNIYIETDKDFNIRMLDEI